MAPTVGCDVSVCGRTNSWARARAVIRVRKEAANARASGYCRADRATRAVMTAKMFLMRWLSSWLISSRPCSSRFSSSMSVQVPNQRLISPSGFRTAAARPRVQR